MAKRRRIKNKRKAYLYIRKEHLEHVGGRIASVEEHQLGFLQMVWRQAFLNLKETLSRIIKKKKKKQWMYLVKVIRSS